MAQALQGIRVLELGDFLPTAFCCMQLADFGADVIRVEPPPRASQGRRAEQAAQVPPETRSPFQAEPPFDTTGRNRRSVVLDLKDERGREVGRRLAAGCDVLVEGFRLLARGHHCPLAPRILNQQKKMTKINKNDNKQQK